MLIREVRALQPVSPNSPPDWRTSMGQILVAIDTNLGLTGYGVGGGGLAAVHIVRTVLRDILLGQEAKDLGALWQGMYEGTLPFGRKGLAIMALSGVDLALWDLIGKAERKPVAVLLGGTTGKKIPTYITVWDEVDPGLVQSHHAFKLHVGQIDSQREEEIILHKVEMARRAIGPNRPLMIDAWMKWTVPQTLKLAKQIQHLKVDWLEEPLSPDDLAGYAQLRDDCPIPIAGGEHEFTSVGFAPLVENRLHQIIQPDVCWCGGLTELIKIHAMAKKAGLRVCPHRGAEPWGLHAIAALDSNPLAESGRPWMTWVGGQPEIKDGHVQLNDQPGFGVHIDEDNLPYAT